jgi:hypothetical protein
MRSVALFPGLPSARKPATLAESGVRPVRSQVPTSGGAQRGEAGKDACGAETTGV